MKLSPEQLAQFERDGYLFFPSLFSPEEMKVPLDEVPKLYAEHRPEIVREKDGVTPRTSFAAHMMIFHGCLVHGSPSNMSPWNRVIVYLSLCAVSNHITRFTRPDYIAHRDFTPIDCLPDDCLLRSDVKGLPWPSAKRAA